MRDESDVMAMTILVDRWSKLNKEYIEERDGELVKKIMEHLGEFPSVPLLEEVMKRYNEKSNQIVRGDLKDLLLKSEVSVQKMTLSNGTELSLQEKFQPKVLDESGFYKFLRENKMDSIIKGTMTFEKGTPIKDISEDLAEKGYAFSVAEGIHFKTLESFAKNYINDIRNKKDALKIPEQVFTVDTFQYVKIKQGIEND